MSGETNNYLTVFGLSFNASIDEKVAAFSLNVYKIYFEIKNEVRKNPNYIYTDDEKVRFLTELRNDIMLFNPSLISDYTSIRYDYICIKCKTNKKNALSYRRAYSYISDVDDIDQYNRLRADLLPYILPQDRESALNDLKKISDEDFCSFIESFIMLCHGEPYESIIDGLEVKSTQYKTLSFYGLNAYYRGGGFINLLSRYARNGTEYVQAFFKKLHDRYGLAFNELSRDEEKVLSEIDDNRDKNIKSILSLQNTLFTPYDCNESIVILDMDFYVEKPVDDCKLAIVDFYRKNGVFGSVRPVTASNISNENGYIYIEIKNKNGVIDINVHIPDEVNSYQEKMLLIVLEELRKALKKRRKKNKTRNSVDCGFLPLLGPNINYDAKTDTLMDLKEDIISEPDSIVFIENAIKVIEGCLGKKSSVKKRTYRR